MFALAMLGVTGVVLALVVVEVPPTATSSMNRFATRGLCALRSVKGATK